MGGSAASQSLFDRALAVTPGGVNSPVRAFRGVGGTPRFMASGHGPYLVDVDGREYVDLVCSWGPLVLGHAYPAVVDAVGDSLEVLVDGGIRSGLDMFKALALGARACLVGRAWAWSVAAGGRQGVVDVLSTMRSELGVALSLTGAADVHALDPSALLDGEGQPLGP